MNLDTFQKRAKLIQTIRAFFTSRDYLEVDTPALAAYLIPESIITPFETRFESPFHGPIELSLVPSPELWMKRLLAEGSGDIFQIGHSFRNAEQVGRYHAPEFTMLEWYSVGANYLDSADLTDELLEAVLTVSPSSSETLRPPCMRMSMAEAFDELAGVDLAACAEIEGLRSEAERAGIVDSSAKEWEELFNALFLSLVEPGLPKERPLILYDYPSKVPTLAKPISGTPWSERWELYVDGMEVANCFSEETNPARVGAFYEHELAKIRESGRTAKPDRSFTGIFGNGFPESSGVALGVDRLLMALLGIRDIRGVIFFPFTGIFDQPG